ncbi:MAG: SRPBCC domain-containing protein [Sphingobium sp.]|uniref:SRPBCC family protein n=1 Tax=Sphingobium sp. TaxID=1912891 RepID=UPI0029AF9A57|nr:SRPBCC domain-containing protein [Sphingobium sp.]MDX3910560.1 SRPBCC domain-containing protein [Sphingobium sp.]
MRFFLSLASAALLASSATASVTSASDAGFDTVSTVEIAASPADVYAVLVTPARWWVAAHSYSGKAANLSINPQAGGCFCESLPATALTGAGSVEHARVLYAQPASTLRLSGALGPLQAEAAVGTLTFTLEPAGQGTKVTMSYVVGGHIRGGAAAVAPIVDQVMAQQLHGLKAAAEKRAP